MRTPLVVVLLVSASLAQTPAATPEPLIKLENHSQSLAAKLAVNGDRFALTVKNNSSRTVHSFALGCAAFTLLPTPTDGIAPGAESTFEFGIIYAPMPRYQSAYVKPQPCSPVVLHSVLFQDGGTEGDIPEADALKSHAQKSAEQQRRIAPILDRMTRVAGPPEARIAAIEQAIVNIKELSPQENADDSAKAALTGEKQLMVEELQYLLKEVQLISRDSSMQRATDAMDKRIEEFTKGKQRELDSHTSAAAKQLGH